MYIDYQRINFQNYPSTVTPLSASNLNKMDKGIADCVSALKQTSAVYIFKGSVANFGSLPPIPQDKDAYFSVADEVTYVWSDEQSKWINIGKTFAIDLSGEDYIVEQGKLNGWVYRKWVSGMSECFGEFKLNVDQTEPEGALHLKRFNKGIIKDYPLNLFKETPICFSQVMGGSLAELRTNEVLTVQLRKADATNIGNVFLYFVVPCNGTFYLSVKAIGEWK